MKKLVLNEQNRKELSQLYAAGDYSKFNYRVAEISGKIKIGVVLDDLIAAGKRLKAFQEKHDNAKNKMINRLVTDRAKIEQNPTLADNNEQAIMAFRQHHKDYAKERKQADWDLVTVSTHSAYYSWGSRISLRYVDDETNSRIGSYKPTAKHMANYLQKLLKFNVIDNSRVCN